MKVEHNGDWHSAWQRARRLCEPAAPSPRLRHVAAAPHDGPTAVLDALDRASSTTSGAGLTTIGYGEYDPTTGRLRYACAGPPPLLVTDHHAQFLTGGRSRPLAATAEPRPEATVVVSPGFMLLGTPTASSNAATPISTPDLTA